MRCIEKAISELVSWHVFLSDILAPLAPRRKHQGFIVEFLMCHRISLFKTKSVGF